MKKTTMILMTLALAAPVFAQEKPAAPAPAPAPAAVAQDADPIIMTAGDCSVRKSDFEAAVKTLPAEYQSFAIGAGKKQFAEDYLRMKLLAAQGLKSGLDKDPEVTAQLNLMRENLVATAQLKKIESGLTVTDADLQKAYDQNKKDYEQVKASHILIAFKGSPAAQPGKKELTEAEAKAKAEEIRAKVVAGGDFAALAKAESDDTGSGSRGGELGGFSHGQMVPEFEEAAFKAKVGEITPVVKTQYGYHVIKVESHENTPLEQVKPTLEKNVRQQKLHEALDAIKDNAHPTFDEAYFTPPAPPAPPAAAAPQSAPVPATPAADPKKATTPKKKG